MNSQLKLLGFVLVTVGFVGGALVAVIDVETVRWDYFSGCAGVGVIGVAMMRLVDRQQKQSAHRVSANIDALTESLDRIVQNIKDLNADKADINTYDVHKRIDELFKDDLLTFVEARESMVQVYGLQAYADVMSSFAAAERYLNRCWSASADGYIDEVNMYLERAANQFRESRERVNQLRIKN
jgi:hypothetical protein